MNKKQLLEYTGSISQYAGITSFTYGDGKGKGVDAYRVKTGAGLEFTVLRDRALDIFECSYKGVNMSYITRNGLVSPKYYYPDNGFNFVMSGGLFFTAGLGNTGIPCSDGEKNYPMHGRLHCCPALDAYGKAEWLGDEQIFEIGGSVQDSSVSSCLVLHRKITAKMDSNEIVITDTVENYNPREAEFSILHHIDMGFPFVDENSILRIDGDYEVEPLKTPAELVSTHKTFGKPVISNEENYTLDIKPDAAGFASVRLENPGRGFGVRISASKDTLPYFNEWKSRMPGEYTFALEPSNNKLHGLVEERRLGNVRKLPPFGSATHTVILSIYDL